MSAIIHNIKPLLFIFGLSEQNVMDGKKFHYSSIMPIYKICPNMVTACCAHTENGKFSQNGLKMVLGYQGLRPWP